MNKLLNLQNQKTELKQETTFYKNLFKNKLIKTWQFGWQQFNPLNTNSLVFSISRRLKLNQGQLSVYNDKKLPCSKKLDTINNSLEFN